MSENVSGLFFAGQVNRTSGYEEAAAQGLWAGMSASIFLNGGEGVLPDRSRSYMETLVDDLTTKGSEEPYRLFTSRSEYRLYLREDNAPERLFSLAVEKGLLLEEQQRNFAIEKQRTKDLSEKLSGERIRLSKDRVISLYEYLKRPEITWEELSLSFSPSFERAIERVEIEAKYSGYISRIEDEIRQLQRLKEWKLDPSIDVGSVPGVSIEIAEKFKALKPKTVFELSRISGVTPTSIISIARRAGKAPASVSHETISPR